MSTNPTIINLDVGAIIPNGENWLMEVDFDTGSTGAAPFIDMNGDGVLDAVDLLPVSGNNSIVPMGRLLSYGVASQPILAQMATNSRSFLNTNADYQPPDGTTDACTGVCGGHFDWDIYAKCDYKYSGTVVTGWGGCNAHTHTHQYDDRQL